VFEIPRCLQGDVYQPISTLFQRTNHRRRPATRGSGDAREVVDISVAIQYASDVIRLQVPEAESERTLDGWSNLMDFGMDAVIGRGLVTQGAC
jgi:hypothetical protein